MPGISNRNFNAQEFATSIFNAQEFATSIMYTPVQDYMNSISISYANPLQDENDKLKNTINEMAKFIDKMDIDDEICSKVELGVCEKYNNGNCIECIKKYFT